MQILSLMKVRCRFSDLSLRYRKKVAQGFAAMHYCAIFGTVLEKYLSEPAVLRKTKRFPLNTNLVNFDAALRFL